MKQEYSFTLSVPLADADKVADIIEEIKQRHPQARITRKTDRKGLARYYLSFPFSDARPDLKFQEWFIQHQEPTWVLFGPTYGRWGLC